MMCFDSVDGQVTKKRQTLFLSWWNSCLNRERDVMAGYLKTEALERACGNDYPDERWGRGYQKELT